MVLAWDPRLLPQPTEPLELNWKGSRLWGGGGLGTRRLGSGRPESAGRQAGRAQSSHAWGGDGAGMFLPHRPGPCPPRPGSGSCGCCSLSSGWTDRSCLELHWVGSARALLRQEGLALGTGRRATQSWVQAPEPPPAPLGDTASHHPPLDLEFPTWTGQCQKTGDATGSPRREHGGSLEAATQVTPLL